MESELSVRDVLTTEYVGVSESDTVLGAVQLMREERASCVLVVRGSKPIGIVTEWDVLGLVAKEGDPAETTIGSVMTTPVLTVDEERPLTDAADLMAKENVRNLIVEAELSEEIVGVLTQRDVIAAAGSFQAPPVASTEGSLEEESSLTPEDRPESSIDTPGEIDSDRDLLANGGDEYTTQGVCESCGSLADSLSDANGKLVCSDCRAL